uniref:ATP synthase CF1 epsilon subunit n=1 Tax=Cuscuta chinensis TaxID=267557 RepID=UPI002435BED5|nr:ATP synthase CF1 epsilon subunit [Cuscuta chinensis]WEY29846.1 ATP synthase CF1 epsilon subunit [Cuscuta chinensis]
MTSLKLCVLTPNRIVWDSEVEQIILSTNSGQLGILPNHIPIATALDIGILRLNLNGQWFSIALMGGVARIANNAITILVTDAERGSEISCEEAQESLKIAETNFKKAEGMRQKIEANFALRRAQTRIKASNALF